jgi:LCP family protein required for cell wall assembly
MQRLKRKFYKHLPLIKTFLKIFFICFLLYCLLFRLLPITFRYLSSSIKKTGLFLSFLKPRQPNLKNSQGRTNLLLLGAGGANHAAPDLTDTLIFTSIDLETGKTLLLSIPRDIWVDSLKAKINTAYHWGEEKKKGGGLILAKATVSEILDQPVHYAILIDFDGFVKAIDLVSGIDIDVERAFDDYQYPVPGMEEAEPEELRYEHLHFDKGWQHMDGEKALKYVRSRYAEGEEGTDFARSKRQQKFLLALKEKIFSLKTLLNPGKIKELVAIFGDSMDTDFLEKEYPELLKLAFKFDQAKIKSVILNEDLLYNPPKYQYDGQWVLAPLAGDWQEVHEFVKQLIASH